MRCGENKAADFAGLSFRYYLRLKTADADGLVAYLENSLGDVRVLDGSSSCEIVTGEVRESDMQSLLSGMTLGECESLIRIL